MASEVVRLGVVGVGGMGSGHCQMIPKIEGATLAAVCDVDEPTRAAVSRKHEVPGFATHIELLESGLVDAVVIATPHYFHPTIAIDAFARGIHVLSEKPLAVTVSSADRMIAQAKQSGLKFGIMYQMRIEPQNQAAKKIVSSGELGEIYRTSLIMGWYRSQAYYNAGGWRATWSGEGGGVLINQAPHLLDLFSWLGGLPARLTGSTRTRLHDIEVEDEAFATLEYANGAHGYLYASTTEHPGTNRIEICGDRGKLTLDNSKLTLTRIDPGLRHFTQENTAMWASPKAEEATVELPMAPPYKEHSAITHNFVRSILYGDPLVAPGEDGLNAVELIDGLILSSKTGRTVSLPVNRAEYDTLIAELQATSRTKASLDNQRVTDPKFA